MGAVGRLNIVIDNCAILAVLIANAGTISRIHQQPIETEAFVVKIAEPVHLIDTIDDCVEARTGAESVSLGGCERFCAEQSENLINSVLARPTNQVKQCPGGNVALGREDRLCGVTSGAVDDVFERCLASGVGMSSRAGERKEVLMTTAERQIIGNRCMLKRMSIVFCRWTCWVVAAGRFADNPC